ncbi:MAG: TolC family protein [Cytophagaceae bacterium]|nr:TolC family protein [Cytophagaceae bacterium]
MNAWCRGLSNKCIGTGVYLILLLLMDRAFAQAWNLRTCVEYAETNNLSVQRLQNTTRMAEATEMQSKGALLPSLNGSVSHNYNFGRTIDPFTNQFTTSSVRSNNASLTSAFTIFSGGQLRHSVKQAQYDHLASLSDEEEARRNLRVEVTAAYLDVQLQAQLVKQASTNVLLSKATYDRSAQLAKGGVLAESDLAALEAQWRSDEWSVSSAQAQYELSLLLLKNTMNFPLNDNLLIDTLSFNYVPVQYQLDSCLHMALSNHPGIKSAQWRIQSGKEAYLAAYGRYFPRLSLSATLSTLYSSSAKQVNGYTFNGNQVIGVTQNGLDTVVAPSLTPQLERKAFANQWQDNLNRFVGLTLSIPVFNGYQVRSAVQRSRLNWQNATLDQRIKENAVRQEVVRNYASYRSASIQWQSAKVSAEASKIAWQQASKRWEAGLGNAFEVTQAQLRFVNAQTEETRARYELGYRANLLEFYLRGTIQ